MTRKNEDASYRELLEKLLRFDNPEELEDILQALETYDADRAEGLVTLDLPCLHNTLIRYLDNLPNARQVEDWANAVEIREDILLEKSDEKLIHDLIWQLANPDINQEITPQLVETFLTRSWSV